MERIWRKLNRLLVHIEDKQGILWDKIFNITQTKITYSIIQLSQMVILSSIYS
jgi:hypothetical protein